MIHTAAHSGDNRYLLFLDQCFNRRQPLPDNQVTVNIRAIKNQVPGRIQQRFPVKKATVLIDFLCAGFAVSQYNLTGKIFSCRIYEMRFLGVNTPCHLHDTSFFQRCFDLRKFAQFFQWLCKSSHPSTFLLYSFIAASILSVRILTTASAARSKETSTFSLSAFEKRLST